jgi:DNA replication protein DnaC
MLRSNGIKLYRDNDEIIIACNYPYHADKLNEYEQIQVVLNACHELDNTIISCKAVSDARYFEKERKEWAAQKAAEDEARKIKEKEEYATRLVESEKNTRIDWLCEASIPHRNQNDTFDNFQADIQPIAIRRCKEFSELDLGNNAMALVLISKIYGIGKTHLLVSIARKLMDNTKAINEIRYDIYRRPCPVYYISEPELMATIRNTYQAGQELSEADVFNKLNSYPLLIIDDVGKVQPKDISFVQQVYYRLIEYRYSQLKSIALATNLEGEEFDNFIGGAVVSRLVEMTMGKYFVTMRGQDYRIAKVKKGDK